MQNNYVRFFCVISFVFVSLLLSAKSSYSKSLELSDADLVYVNPDFRSNVLRLSFSYLNRETNRRVHWQEGSVDCNCVVYPIASNNKKLENNPIYSREFLTSYKKAILIDMPESFAKEYQRGVVECTMQVGWKNLKTEEMFGVYR